MIMGYAEERRARLDELKSQTHMTADGYPITVGEWYWDNDLKVVQITAVAVDFTPYPECGTQVWHKHTRGMSDSLTDRPDIGRLAKYWRGKPASEGATP
jgi:hypothetical protein